MKFSIYKIKNWKSPSLLKDSFAEYKIFAFQFFNFSALNATFHYLLTFMVSDDKSTVNFIKDLSVLSFCFQYSLSLVFNSLIIICFVWLNLSYLDLVEILGYVGTCISSNLGKFQPLLLPIFLLPLSLFSRKSLYTYICMPEDISQVSEVLLIFLQYFLCCSSDWVFLCPIFKFTDFFLLSQICY